MIAVFHVVLWTESPNDIMMSLGLEGAIATRAVADAVAETYCDCLRIAYEVEGYAAEAFRTRVGILEVPKADPQLKHPEPRDDVEAIAREIRDHYAKRQEIRDRYAKQT